MKVYEVMLDTINKYLNLIGWMELGCPDENHPHVIDMGLPSGTKWACCNVGASEPEGHGCYYAWGEKQTKHYYGPNNYEISGYGEFYKQLKTNDDVANIYWGSPWHVPTFDEMEELLTYCDFSWTKLNGVRGGKIISRNNGHSVFLPAAGWRGGWRLNNLEKSGGYWSSTSTDVESYAYFLSFDTSGVGMETYPGSCIGRNVRPVAK